jgi:hypothetical protein
MKPKERVYYRKVGGVMTKYEQVLQVRRAVKANNVRSTKSEKKKVNVVSLPQYIRDNPFYP